MRSFACWFGILLAAGCAMGRVYSEADAPAERDARVEAMPAPDFLKPETGVFDPNHESLKRDLLAPERGRFVPVQLWERQKIISAEDLREIASMVGRIRPSVDPWVIRQVSIDRPEDGLWVLVDPNLGVQFYLVEGRWIMARRFFMSQ